MKMVKEAIEPIAGPDMVHHDDFISQHEEGAHKHHSKDYITRSLCRSIEY